MLVDPKTGRPAAPSQPNMFDVPCQCGHVNRVECKPPRLQNLPQTSIIVLEHCGPLLCAGCMRGVVLCAVDVQTIILRLLPIKPTEQPVPVEQNPASQQVATTEEVPPPADGEESPSPETAPDRVM